MRNAYGITSWFDPSGADKKDNDDNEQADLCELIRAALFSNKLGPLANYGTSSKLNKNFLMKLDCPGKEGVTEPCAYNESDFWDQELWTIIYRPIGLRFDNKPTFITFDEAKNLKFN